MSAHDATTTLAETYGDPLPLIPALRLIHKLCNQVEQLHGRGKIHGNLNPKTVLTDENGDIIVNSGSDEVPSPKFQAPELNGNQTPDSRCDVYSIGMLLHWLITHQLPQDSQVSNKLPHELHDVLTRAIEQNPEDRIQTISGLTNALKSLDDIDQMERELELAVRATGFDPRLLWKRHQKSVLVILILSALLSSGLVWWHIRHQEIQRQQAQRRKEQKQREARIRHARSTHELAANQFQHGEYSDAITNMKKVLSQTSVPSLHEDALYHMALCYKKLEDPGAEYSTWLRLLQKYPQTDHSSQANKRLARIASLTLKKHGGFKYIATRNDILVDGLPADWQGIKPLIQDTEGDQRRGDKSSDLKSFYAAVKGDRMYLRFDTQKPPQTGDQYCVAIDLHATAHGESTEQWDYQFGVADGVPPWLWDLRGDRSYANTNSQRLHGVKFAQKRVVEISIPLSAIGSPCNASLRAFINYKGHDDPNDLTPRKVLVTWCNTSDDSTQSTPITHDTTEKENKSNNSISKNQKQ